MEETRNRLREAKNIVVFTGAGVSTSAGIPDYRSNNGIFSTMGRGAFSRANKNSEAFKELANTIEAASPTDTHRFCVDLWRRGKLRRVYTQNIDGLHQKAGLPEYMVVEVHGSLKKDNIVFYDEPIPPEVLLSVKNDLIDKAGLIDVVIVMGTSLSVYPFALLPNMVRKTTLRIFVNNDLNVLPLPVRKSDTEGMYSSPGSSYMKICGQAVTTKPTWFDSRKQKNKIRLSKYRTQYLFKAFCDDWVKEIGALEMEE